MYKKEHVLHLLERACLASVAKDRTDFEADYR